MLFIAPKSVFSRIPVTTGAPGSRGGGLHAVGYDGGVCWYGPWVDRTVNQ
jgi:hypothetical protein